MRPRLWTRRAEAAGVEADRLAAAMGVAPVIARLLVQRGLSDPDEAARFLAPRLEHLVDPFRLTDLGRAVDRLLAAIDGQESIAIHGDYDVDGITSTVILRRAIELLGGRVAHFLPERVRDGYGLQVPAVERLHADGVGLLVSVDCGIRSLDAAARARDLGIDLIVTDHHEPDATLPPALAVLNPKRADCAYPDKHLAGVGVALKLVHGLCARRGREHWLPAFVKMAAIGTIADVVPLVGENRVIAKLGLELLSNGRHKIGLRALLEVAGLAGRQVGGHHVGFFLGPRLNAAGRMGSPELAARLLLLDDERDAPLARDLATRLDEENKKRQAEEAAILAAARRAIEADPDIGAHNALVVAGEGWHRGVVGIVASKLVESFHRPVVVLAVEDGVAHGSCRSIPAFDMLGGLERCSDLLLRFGGHRQAAGLSLEAGRVGDFRRRLTAHANEVLEPDDLRPRLGVDLPLRLAEITPALVEGLAQLAPFGLGNERPVFSSGGVEVVDGPSRLKERHLVMTVRQDGRRFRAIAWRAAERQPLFDALRSGLDVAYHVERNTFRDETTIELQVLDARAPGGATEDAPASDAPEGMR